MSQVDVFTRKLAVFLHDPIDKPLILMKGIAHQERAKRLMDLLNLKLDIDEGADWIASSMERVLLPKGSSRKKELQVQFLDNPQIKHPLSGTNLDCSSLKSVRLSEILEKVNEVTSELSIDGSERQFLNLWRNYIDKLKEATELPLQKYWPYIPADTRVPDHSIFEHLRIASACFNSMLDRDNKLLHHNLAFFLCSLGPVQSFISTARKLQDLWMGSFILSYLAWCGIKVVIEKYGPDSIIFPDLYKQPLVDHWLKYSKGIDPVGYSGKALSLPTLPNRFLAIVPNEDLENLGEIVEKTIQASFIKIGFEAFHRLKGKSKNGLSALSVDAKELKRHLATFLDIYWVAVPWPKSTSEKSDYRYAIDLFKEYLPQRNIERIDNAISFFERTAEYVPNIGTIYEVLYHLTERALSSRKVLRNFSQTIEHGRKCSLCGERKAFLDASTALRKYRKGLMGESEYLCGVCLTKRLGRYAFTEIFEDYIKVDFPSIAEVAVSDLKLVLLMREPRLFQRYVEKCQDLFGKEFAHSSHLLDKVKQDTNYDGINIGGEFFIEDFLTPKNLSKALDLHDESQLSPKKVDELTRLIKRLRDLTSSYFKPSSYYAVVMLDGDNMGKWLKGEFAPSIQKIIHSQVWENLNEEYKKNLIEISNGGKRFMSPSIHASISAALRNYSLTLVRRIVEQEHLGKLIYAGGDDVLALVNLRDLVDVMTKLRAAFSGHIFQTGSNLAVDFRKEANGFIELENQILLTMGPTATASMGVVIAHYKMPFGMVLDKVRSMEKKAKENQNKDSFAIALIKHSGESRECVTKWRPNTVQNPLGTLGIVKKLAVWIREDKISNNFIYTLGTEFRKMTNEHGEISVFIDILQTELERLMKRSQIEKNSSIIAGIASLSQELFTVFEEQEENFTNFMAFLEIANFLAREIRRQSI